MLDFYRGNRRAFGGGGGGIEPQDLAPAPDKDSD
jgi:hypothetical protein